jgi:hypothetical protein
MGRHIKKQRIKTVRIRRRCTTKAESLRTETTIECSLEALCKYINYTFTERGEFIAPVTPERVHIKGFGHDVSIDWDVELITIDGYGVWGMADGFIASMENQTAQAWGLAQ